MKRVKPAPGTVRIDYAEGAGYAPDFVVETTTEKLPGEPKREDEVTDPVVQAKARAAATWCRHATQHELAHGGKPWRYLLIPHSSITANATLAGLAARHSAT